MSRSSTPRLVKGLAPLACKTDRIDAGGAGRVSSWSGTTRAPVIDSIAASTARRTSRSPIEPANDPYASWCRLDWAESLKCSVLAAPS